LQSNAASVAFVFAIAIACSAVSFAISNGAFYWLGGRYAEPNLGEYLARLWTWGPLFVRTTSCYVGVALLVQLALSRRGGVHDAAASADR
jgi:H+/gluconate symporter-like permease